MRHRANWKMYHKTLTLADTEYSQAVGAWPIFLSVQAQSLVDIRISFDENGTNDGSGNFKTIFAGSQWEVPHPVAGAKVIYLRCKSTAGVVVEIEEWT